jgi:beta-aspartyl-peptidase (threonine type)
MKEGTPIVIASGNGAPGLAAGIAMLRRGGSALDAVEASARVIEADPSDTGVGRGGKPNVLGVVELDAFSSTERRAASVPSARSRATSIPSASPAP